MNLALNFNNYYCSFEKLHQTIHKKVKEEGKWNQTVSCTCFWDRTTGDAPVTYWPIFVPVTSNTPRSLNLMQFPFRY